MLIRPALATDFDAIAELTNIYINTTVVHFSYDPVTPAELQAQWEKYRARYPFLIAEVEGRFAGYAKAGVWRDRTAYQWTPECGIYIAPTFQGKGVGSALYQRLIDQLRAQGFHSVIGGITLPNDASVRLHEKMGFVKCSHIRHAGWKYNKWHDVGFWQLMLADEGHAARPLGELPASS